MRIEITLANQAELIILENVTTFAPGAVHYRMTTLTEEYYFPVANIIMVKEVKHHD